MKLKFGCILLGLAATAFAGSINIVQNGDFETGDLTGWTINNPQTSDVWFINSPGNNGSSFAASTGCVGDPCVNGDSTQQNFLTQILSTNIGDSYTLSFWYNPGDFGGEEGIVPNAFAPNDTLTIESELVALFGGVSVADIVLTTTSLPIPSLAQVDGNPGTYTQYTITGLVATSTSTELTFLDRQDPSFSFLDDVVVTDDSAVPEPSSYLFAAGGLLALGLTKWRTRRA